MAVLLGTSSLSAMPQTTMRPLPPAAPALEPVGAGQLAFFGFRVYEAQLWAAPGFRAADFERHLFALDLHYVRDLASADIARRSVQEMERAGRFTPEDAQRWQAALRRVVPDVQPGDRIIGVNRPGRGAEFIVNGKVSGEIAEPRFSALFFAIWLAPTTSEPRLRQMLLGEAR